MGRHGTYPLIVLRLIDRPSGLAWEKVVRLGVFKKLEFIITAYCIAFLIMGFGFGAEVQGGDSGGYIFTIGFAFLIILAIIPSTSTTTIRRYRIPDEDGPMAPTMPKS